MTKFIGTIRFTHGKLSNWHTTNLDLECECTGSEAPRPMRFLGKSWVLRTQWILARSVARKAATLTVNVRGPRSVGPPWHADLGIAARGALLNILVWRIG